MPCQFNFQFNPAGDKEEAVSSKSFAFCITDFCDNLVPNKHTLVDGGGRMVASEMGIGSFRRGTRVRGCLFLIAHIL